jgi:negative regulator of sigma E activity
MDHDLFISYKIHEMQIEVREADRCILKFKVKPQRDLRYSYIT